MIGNGKRRKDVYDDNNYIKKYGKVTHICPECGNLYTANLMLNVDCQIDGNKEEREGYSVTTPSIGKTCACGAETIQVDNEMGLIVKMLIEKGYTLHQCCEGHAYANKGLITYDFPYLMIYGNIKALIPASYFKKLFIYYEFGITKILCKSSNPNYCECPCESLDTFNEYKENALAAISGLVKSLPNNPACDDSNSSDCGCCCCR